MSESDEDMTLEKALMILVDSYTRDDDRVGFTVQVSGDYFGRWQVGEQTEAWKAVRKHIRRPVGPEG